MCLRFRRPLTLETTLEVAMAVLTKDLVGKIETGLSRPGGRGPAVRASIPLMSWRTPMRIRPLALCLGISVTPGFALTAHADAGYNVTVLKDPGGLGNSGPFFGAINDAGQSV